MEGWQEKVLKWLITAGVAVLTGGGAFQITTGGTVGQVIFSGYRAALEGPVRFVNPENIAEVHYKRWAGELVLGSLNFGPELILLIAPMLLLMAHIVAKDNVRRTPEEPRELPPGKFWERIYGLLPVYGRLYALVTWAVFSGLLAFMFAARQAFWLAGLFVLLQVPAALYLFFYRADLHKGAFTDRLLYISIPVFFLAALIAFPKVYGERFFDLRLRPIDLSSERAGGRDLFMIPGRAQDPRIVCAVSYEGDRLKLEFVEHDPTLHKPRANDDYYPLRALIDGHRPPVSAPQDQAVGDFLVKLETAVAGGS